MFRQCTTPELVGLPPEVADIVERRSMGYAFDDGQNCTHVDYLANQKQKLTMIYRGSDALDWPLEAQLDLADGHEICARKCLHFLALVSCS